MRLLAGSSTIRRFTALLIGLSVACSYDAPTSSSPGIAPRIDISVEPRTATVMQGDSSQVVAVVSANFELGLAPQVVVTGAPPGVSARVSRVDQATRLAAVALMIAVAPTTVPGTYGLLLHATNSALKSPVTGFSLTVELRPDCSPAAPCIQWAVTATASSQYTGSDWSALQATGAPNVTGCSDNTNAWASLGSNTVEWLEVQFGEAMIPAAIRLHENYGPSSITSIEVKDEQGAYHRVYTSTPGHLSCPSIRTIPVTEVAVKVKAIRLNIDQRVLNDWNEVDAVGLLGYRVK